jgi:glycosyltransferase involved in cell wall biosynthesis
MNLLFATHLPQWGGGEKWMLSAAESMRDRGHSVGLCAPGRSTILERATEAGIDTFAVEFLRDVDPRSFARVYQYCRRQKVDVLCLNMDRVLRIAGLAARLAGVPAVIPRRGSEFPLKSHLNYRFHYQWVTTSMIVNSRATERALCRDIRWKPRGRIHLLYNGLDLAPYQQTRARADVRAELGLAEGDFVILNIGELTSRKNAQLLVGIMPSLRRGFPQTKLLLVGEGTERDALERQVGALGLEDSVRLLGFRRDTPDLLGATDLLAHTAVVEGFGYVVAEAMASGLPTVVSAASSLPEVIEDGNTGTLFEPGNAHELERALRCYLSEPELCRRHGQAGRARVTALFRLEDRMDELESIFRAEAGLEAIS